MDDPFDQILAAALAPDDRHPDRAFVRQVQIAVALQEQLAATRRQLIHRVLQQLAAVAAMAAALIIIARSQFVAALVEGRGPAALAAVMLLFTLFVLAIVPDREESAGPLVNNS